MIGLFSRLWRQSWNYGFERQLFHCCAEGSVVPSLKHINLIDNNLIIANGIFENMPMLESVDIANNRLITVPESLPFSRLTHLDVGRNKVLENSSRHYSKYSLFRMIEVRE